MEVGQFGLELFRSIASLSFFLMFGGFLFFRIQNLSSAVARNCLAGTLFAGLALIGMQLPVALQHGISVDARVVIAALAGYLAGGAGGFLCAAIISAYRISLGGVGAIAGVGAICTGTVIGYLCFRFRGPFQTEKHRIPVLLVLGLAISVTSVAWALALPTDLATKLIPILLKSVPPLFTLCTLWCGRLITFERDRWSTAKFLSEAKDLALRNSILKERFYGEVCHQMRTPLQAIKGAAQAIDMTQDKSQRELLRKILFRSTEHLIGLTERLLQLHKVEKGIELPKFVPTRIEENMEFVFHLFSVFFKEKGVAFSHSVSDSAKAMMLVDPLMINQVLQNLVSNALKYTESGSVTFRADRCVSASGSQHLLLEVADTGAGIPTEEHAKIFEPFFQGRLHSLKKYGGEGLGLTITQGLVEAMKGTVTFESDLSRGSKFVVEIPLPLDVAQGS